MHSDARPRPCAEEGEGEVSVACPWCGEGLMQTDTCERCDGKGVNEQGDGCYKCGGTGMSLPQCNACGATEELQP